MKLMMKSYIIKLIAFASLATMLFSCEVQDDFKYKPSNDKDTGKYKGTAWDFIKDSPAKDSLTLMKEAIMEAKMESLYEQKDLRTFIVPRNIAFRNYFKSKGYKSVKDIPAEELREILKYHVAKGYYYTADPQYMKKNDPIKFDTETVNPMFLSHNGNFQVLVNEGTKQTLTIYISNVRPENGVLHISSAIAFYQPK